MDNKDNITSYLKMLLMNINEGRCVPYELDIERVFDHVADEFGILRYKDTGKRYITLKVSENETK